VIEMRKSVLVLTCILCVGLSGQEAYSPARYQAGTVPALPVTAVGGGQVLLELAVSREGRVTTVSPLRTTAPFTDLVVGAVRDWRFAPAEEDVQAEPGRPGTPASRQLVPSTVLVAALFRQPAFYGPTIGEIPRDVASASAETAFPLTTTVPLFPPSALSSGVVLLEAQVDRNGAVAAGTVIRSAPPFDDAALAAARQWTFRPARMRGAPVATRVYMLFGFPIPVVNVPPPAPANPPRRPPTAG
jgi:TonB family protein